MRISFLLPFMVLALFGKENEIYHDKQSALMWQNNSDVGIVKKSWMDMSKESAKKCFFLGDQNSCADNSGDTAYSYCKVLKLGGFHDWRLPTIEELSSLGHAESNQLMKPFGTFWSNASAKYKGKPREAAFVFVNRRENESIIVTRDKSVKNFIRCVRQKRFKKFKH